MKNRLSQNCQGLSPGPLLPGLWPWVHVINFLGISFHIPEVSVIMVPASGVVSKIMYKALETYTVFFVIIIKHIMNILMLWGAKHTHPLVGFDIPTKSCGLFSE